MRAGKMTFEQKDELLWNLKNSKGDKKLQAINFLSDELIHRKKIIKQRKKKNV